MDEFIGAIVALTITLIHVLVNFLIAIIMIPVVIVAICVGFLRDLFTPARNSRNTISDADFVEVSNNKTHAAPKDDFTKGLEALRGGHYATALRKLRPLAEKGHVVAQTNLGVMYYKGHGVSQNHEEAVKWFKLAAKKGHKSAQRRLGVIYALGLGVPQDYKEAAKWNKLAAEQGDAPAQYNFGRMYMEGHGVSQDYALAYLWFSLAESNGSKDGKLAKSLAKIEMVASDMTPEKIEQTEILAEEWIAKSKN